MVFIIIGSIILGLFLIYIILCFVLTTKIHNQLFNHRQELDTRIEWYSYDDFGVKTDKYECKGNNETIIGYFLHNEKYDESKLFIVCHGMWSTKEAYIQEAGYIAQKGYLVYLFDYLGTNESSGKNLIGFNNSIYSLDIVLNHLKNDPKYQNKDIYLVGHSWGGYAVTNITKLHPDVKGIIALAPMTSVYNIVHFAKPKKPILFSLIFDLVERIKLPNKYHGNSIKNLKNYQGKLLLLQSIDDNVVLFDGSGKLLQKKLPQFTYLFNEKRFHNPDYETEAVKILYKFYDQMRKTNDLDELFNNTDFKACGKIDEELWDQMLNMILLETNN